MTLHLHPGGCEGKFNVTSLVVVALLIDLQPRALCARSTTITFTITFTHSSNQGERDRFLISRGQLANIASKILSFQGTKLLLGESMPVFVVLGNWTNEGLRNVRDAPSRIKDTHNAVAEAGGKMQLYYTLGEYDFIMVLEVPDDKAIMRILLWLGSKGNVRTKTLKAWTEAEAAKEISEIQ